MKKEFIGVKYSTEKQKKLILSKYDEYELLKLKFLNQEYSNFNTLYTMWSAYKNIHYLEIIRGRDIKDFTKQELEELLRCKKVYSTSYKNIIHNFIMGYLDYCVKNNLIKENLCINIDFPKISEPIKPVKKEDKLFFYSLDYYKSLFEMRNENLKCLNYEYSFPILFARYGITGTYLKYITDLKVKDIDFKNKYVNILKKDNVVKRIPVDDMFLDIISKLIQVFERKENQCVIPFSISILYDRQRKFYKDVERNNKVLKKCDFSMLSLMRQFEVLLKLREGRKITIKDVQLVHKLYTDKANTNNSLETLKIMWYKFTGESLVHGNSNKTLKNSVKDKKFVKEIAEKLGINLDNIPVILL